MKRSTHIALVATLCFVAHAGGAAAQWPPDAAGGRGSTGGLTLRPGERMVTLTWQRLDPTAQYRVFRASDSTSLGTDISGLINATTFTDKTVSLNTVYFYHLRAEQSGGMKPMSSAPLRIMLQMGAVEMAGKPVSGPAPPPVVLAVTAFFPTHVRAKTAPASTYAPVDPTITINGTGFTKQSSIAVYFTGTSADNPDVVGHIVSSTATTVVVAVPMGARTGKIKVVLGSGVTSEMAMSPAVLTVTDPATITGFSPPSAPLGGRLLILGKWMNHTDIYVHFPRSPTVTGSINPLGERGSLLGDTAVEVRVPSWAMSGKIEVTVGGGTTFERVTSPTDFIVAPPALSIESFSPSSASVGANVVITGYGHVTPTVTFSNGVRAVVVSTVPGAMTRTGQLSVTTVQVPAGAVAGPITIQSGAQTAKSATSFTPKAP